MLTAKDKVEFLMKEKELTRQELYMYVKLNFTSLFSFFTILAIFLSLYYGKIDFPLANRHYIILIVEQIGYMVIILNLNLQSSIASLAGYIQSLEEKINHFSNEDISQWESIIVKKYYMNWRCKSGVTFSTFLLSFFCILSFLFFAYIIQQLFGGYIFLVVHMIEIFVAATLVRLSLRDRVKSYEFTKMY